MKFVKKIGIVLLLIMSMSAIVFASEEWILGDEPTPSELAGASGVVSNSLGTLQYLGYLTSIGMIIWCGIRYMMAGAGEKAKAKETLVPVFIGSILISSATLIAVNIFNL